MVAKPQEEGPCCGSTMEENGINYKNFYLKIQYRTMKEK